MNKIKILHVLPSLEIGGMENALIHLINGLDSAIFENFIYCFDSLHEKEPLQDRLQNPDIPIFKFYKGNGVDYGLPWRISRTLKKENIDIIHTRNFAALLYGAVASRFAATHCVISDIRGHLPEEQGVKAKRLSFLISQFVTVSNDIRKLMLETFKIPENKIRTIYNGVAENHLNPLVVSARKQLGLGPENFIIGTVGRLEPVKDYGTLVRASQPILRENPAARLLFVGDGSQRPALEKLARELEISNQTIFTGYQQDVNPFIEAIDVFVLSSVSEGISNVLLEAMSNFVPVVATAVGGNPEVVVDKETGFLVPGGDVLAMTEKIQRLQRSPGLRQKLGQAGFRVVQQRFSMQQMIAAYQDLYISLLN
jgi:sugar transferase (PEP-CTERM/EpsH1 system associated)